MKFIFTTFLLLFFTIVSGQNNTKTILVIHGGAGNIVKERYTDEQVDAYKEQLTLALEKGYSILNSGGTSLDAVTATLKILEDSPLFNAGRGAVYTHQETVEHDASIMTGHDMNAGAVAGISQVKNPIYLARKVLEVSEHVMLTGEGATVFAKEQGIEMVDTSYFYNEDRLKYLRRVKESEKIKDNKNDRGQNTPFNAEEKFGTVGAVALDQEGNLSAGTSTGGMTNKKYGRVGDSPIIGAGTYADNKTCGVSATGHGEFFIRYTVAYDIAALMKYKNYTVQQAAEEVVLEKLRKVGGAGGVIALDAKGNVTMPFNTSGMFRGTVDENGNIEVFLFAPNQ